MVARESRLDPSLHQPIRCLAHIDRIWCSKRLQARCDVHRVARSPHSRVGAALSANDCGPSIEADPKLRLDAVFSFEITAGGLQPLQDGKRRAACA